MVEARILGKDMYIRPNNSPNIIFDVAKILAMLEPNSILKYSKERTNVFTEKW